MPMIDVPVSLIGTLAVMQWLGFSLNNLSMLGLVVAIGIVGTMPSSSSLRTLSAGCPRACQRAKRRLRRWKRSPAGYRHHARAQLGVPAHGFHRGHTRKILSAVRLDHRRVNHNLRHQRNDDGARAGRNLIKPHHPGHPPEALPSWGVGLLAAYLVYRFVFPWIAIPLGIPLAESQHGAEPVTWSTFAWSILGIVCAVSFFVVACCIPWSIDCCNSSSALQSPL